MADPGRRSFLAGMASFALAGASFAQNPAPAPARPRTVRVREGLLGGTEADGVLILKGVPYAEPPIGPLRFRAPRPPLRWSGVRNAMRFGRAPIQGGGDVSLAYLGAERGEDCLYLNIWAPAGRGPHPVFVWIHGGGNEGGAASQPLFDGARFARDGIVCVTIGFRVGMLGFLELGELIGPAWRGSAANGLRDIVAALKWVRDNIAAVGGDPGRVTLGGESAGGKNVCSLMASPQARGLFQSAIVQSGGETIHRPEAALAIARMVDETIMAEGGKPADLVTMPPERIVALQMAIRRRYDRPFPFRAVVDGDFLPQAPIAAITGGSAANIRLLIGTNRDESILFTDRSANPARPLGQNELTNMDLSSALPVFRRYEAAYPELSPLARRVRFVTAEEYWIPSMRIAEGHRRTAGPGRTFVYRFDRTAPAGQFAGWAPHASELPYVWNMPDNPAMATLFGPTDAQRRALAADMHGRWVRFISGDDPWQAFNDRGAMLIFDDPVKPAEIDSAELALW